MGCFAAGYGGKDSWERKEEGLVKGEQTKKLGIAPWQLGLDAPVCDHFFPILRVHNPQSKLVLLIAAKQCQIQRWFVMTDYRNIPSPYLTVPS